jgi:hypothetical protein
MANVLPINKSAAEVQAGAGLTLQADALPANVPTTLADLNSGVQQFISTVSWSVAASLGFTFVSTNFSTSSQVYVQDFLVYKKIDGNGQTALYGVGTRIAVAISSTSASANISSLPFIAASSTFGFSKAEVSFSTPGLKSDKIISLFPKTTSITVETYSEYVNAAAQINNLIGDPSTQVTPQLLWVTAETPEQKDYDAAMARAWALQEISRGYNIYYSIIKNHSDMSDHFKDVFRQVYLDVAGITAEGDLPDELAQAKARKLLLSFKVSD